MKVASPNPDWGCLVLLDKPQPQTDLTGLCPSHIPATGSSADDAADICYLLKHLVSGR